MHKLMQALTPTDADEAPLSSAEVARVCLATL
jgi:hypothetical protein